MIVVNIQEVIQMTSLMFCLFGIAVWISKGRRYPQYWPFIVPIISWLSHAAIFYGFVLVDTLTKFDFISPAGYNLWSTIVRIHAVILCVGMGLVLGEASQTSLLSSLLRHSSRQR